MRGKALRQIAEMRNGRKILIGHPNNYLQETLNLISEKKQFTASELSAALKLPANTSGTRLLKLERGLK